MWTVILLLAPLLAVIGVSAAGAQESTLHKVLKRGHLIIGTRSTTPGFAFKDDKGELVGFEIDLAREIGKSLFNDPAKVTFELLGGGAERIPALTAGRVDAVISQFSVYIERAQVVEFSLPYVTSDGTLLVKAGSPYKKNTDLNGKTIATRQGAELEKVILAAIPKGKVTMLPNLADAFLAFKQGRAEAYFNDLSALVFIRNENPGQFRILIDQANPIDPQQSSIGVKQGDQIWLNYLNWALMRLKMQGKIHALHRKWLGTEDMLPRWVREPY